MSILGENIKKLRKEYGWSLAALSNKTSIPISTLNGIEKGANPSYEKIENLANAFNLPPESLIYKTPKELTGKEFAKRKNEQEEEINLLYKFLKSKYAHNINMNQALDERFIELYIGNNEIIYTKEDFQKFSYYVFASFQNFNTLISNSNK